MVPLPGVSGPVNLTLKDARIAATYMGNPATTLMTGEIRAFISKADADQMISVPPLTLVLSSALTTGDQDMQVNAPSVVGWYFYLNFTAEKVALTP